MHFRLWLPNHNAARATGAPPHHPKQHQGTSQWNEARTPQLHQPDITANRRDSLLPLLRLSEQPSDEKAATTLQIEPFDNMRVYDNQ